MLIFSDEQGNNYSALCEYKEKKGVNGEKSLSGTIYTNDKIIEKIDRGWSINVKGEIFKITFIEPVDSGNKITIEFDAVHEFFFDMDKSIQYEVLNGSHTMKYYLDFIFKDSSYIYNLEVDVPAFEKDNFGLKSRLDLFKDVISSTGLEFSVSGKVVRILKEVGTDLSTIVKKGFNLNELTIERDVSSFVTYMKGLGAYNDDEDHSKGRLEVEYLSPLSKVYGKLEGRPVVDERYTNKSALLSRIKNEVDSSYNISVSIDMSDLTRAGYKYDQPHEGDYIMAINDDMRFRQRIRIMSYETEYDTEGNVINHVVTCGSSGIASRTISNEKKKFDKLQQETREALDKSNSAMSSADGKNTIYRGNKEPTNPRSGDTWFHTIGDETIMKQWNGHEWVKVFNPKEIEDAISEVDSKVLQGQKDSKEALEKANDSVKKANEAVTKITATENSINSIKSDAANAIVNSNKAKDDAKKVLDSLENFEIGGRNLILNSTEDYREFKFTSFRMPLTDWISVEKLGLKTGDTVTLSAWIKAPENFNPEGLRLQVGFRTKDNKVSYKNTSYVMAPFEDRFTFTVDIPEGSISICAYLETKTSTKPEPHSIFIKLDKFEKGNKATDWTPAPEDTTVEIKKLSDSLATKVSQSQFDTLNKTVSTQQTEINQNKNSINLKADKTFVDTLKGTVDKTTSDLKIEAGKITALNIKTDGHTTQIGKLQSDVNSFSSTISKFENFEVGGRNLILNSTEDYREFKFTSFRMPLTDWISVEKLGLKTGDTVTLSAWIKAPENFNPEGLRLQVGFRTKDNKVSYKNTSYVMAPFEDRFTFTVDIPEGSISICAYLETKTSTKPEPHSIFIKLDKFEKGNKATDWTPAPGDLVNNKEFSSIVQKINVIQNTVQNKADKSQVTQLANQITSVVEKIDWQHISGTQVDLNDIKTEGKYYISAGVTIKNGPFSGMSYLKVEGIHSTKIIQTIQKENDTSQAYQRVLYGNSWSAWKKNADSMDIDGVKSQITQLSDSINLRVEKNKVVNQINISSEGILISGEKIHISGKTTIDDAVISTAHIKNAAITDAKIGNLSANKITTGTLNAANVSIINLNANNITSGYINANRIQAGSITADKLSTNAIQVGFNSMGNTMQLNSWSLQFFDGGKKSGQLTDYGLEFWDGSTQIGRMGRTFKNGSPSVKGVAMNIESPSNFVTWGYRQKSTDNFYSSMLTMDPNGVLTEFKGIDVGLPLKVVDNQNYVYNLSDIIKVAWALKGLGAVKIPKYINSSGVVTEWFNVNL